MDRRIGLVSILGLPLVAGLSGGGITSSFADEAGIEARVGEVRGAVLSLLAPVGVVATETNPDYKSVVPRRLPQTGRATTRR
jgi:alcohol dehydrogenase (cytochrome c)